MIQIVIQLETQHAHHNNLGCLWKAELRQ